MSFDKQPHSLAQASPMTTVATREFPPQRRSGAAANLERFAPLAGNLEHAASAIARLDAVVTGHPLAAAWGWRSRLDAVRGQAAAEGRLIDAWHLAAVVEGVRFRMDGAMSIIDRGALFDAARHASRCGAGSRAPTRGKHKRSSRPPAYSRRARWLAAARGRQSRPRLARPRWRKTADARRTRAALARLRADARRRAAVDRCRRVPRRRAAAGRGLERRISRHPRRRGRGGIYAAVPPRARMVHRAIGDPRPAARFACRGCGRHHGGGTHRVRDFARRKPRHRGQERHGAAPHFYRPRYRDRSHTSLQAPPLWSQRSGTVARGSEAAAPCPQHQRLGTPGKGRGLGERCTPKADYAARGDVQPPLRQSLVLTPLERKEFEFSDLEDWMREADRVIRRSQAILDRIAKEQPIGRRESTP